MKQHPQDYPIGTLKMDIKVLGDLGLPVPRLTTKFLRGCTALGYYGRVSPYFLLVAAARRGNPHKWLYGELRRNGFVWEDSTWIIKFLP